MNDKKVKEAERRARKDAEGVVFESTAEAKSYLRARYLQHFKHLSTLKEFQTTV